MTDESPGPDIEFRFNQMALPEELPDNFADSLTEQLETGVRAAVVFEPGTEQREFVTAAVLLVIHLATANALDLAVGTASAAFWDGIKKVCGRVHQAAPENSPPMRILAELPDGISVEVDLEDEDQIATVLRQLRAQSAPPAEANE